MAYTYRRTGSARSVGRRRIIKYYATVSGKAIAARSAAGARMDAMRFGEKLTGGFADMSKNPEILDRRHPAAKTTPAAGGGQQAGGGQGGGQQGGNPQDLTATNAAAAGEADLAALKAAALQPGGATAVPATAWNAGEFVTLHDGSKAHWDGSAWAAGAAS